MAVARIEVPKTAKRGEIIEIRTLISHVMENGFRRTYLGVPLPRDIITEFACTYNGVEICRATLYPSIAANPFLSFHTIATESGRLVFNWRGDNGFNHTESSVIAVE
jgi:sulfur-oxidizing protein SoxZ